MSLSAGARVGPYEILSALGASGMGEVYRARDTKLNLDVALKVIPDTFALDPDRVSRFKREAQVLASLNHPHIATIYGFEDSGEPHALVLEPVEGETLADRIARGPIPIDEALPIARKTCEALEVPRESTPVPQSKTLRQEAGTTSTSVETRRTPRTALATSTDSRYASRDFVFPDRSTTPLFTEATLMPLVVTRRFALNAASTLFVIASSDRSTTARWALGTTCSRFLI